MDVEFSLTQEELDNLSALSKEMNKNLPDVVRQCVNERCEELLDMFRHNIPEDNSEEEK
jgi:hypothetical protein